MPESTDSDLQTYHGSCHCGAYAFSVRTLPIREVLSCNCSNCYKHGTLWIYVPQRSVTVEKGEESLKGYWWSDERYTTHFCPTCGSCVYNGSPKLEEMSLNVRMLHDFDLKPLSIKKVDMASSPPLYKAPEPPSFPEVHEGKVVRAGSCHCGAITYTLQTDPDPLQVKRCDCSICHRNAYAWHYGPNPDDLIIHKSQPEALSIYSFGPKRAGHAFCSNCGVPMFNLFTQKVDGFPLKPVNARTLNGGIDVDELEEWKKEIKAGKKDGKWWIEFEDVQEDNTKR